MRSYAVVFKTQSVNRAEKPWASAAEHIEVRSEYYGAFVKEESALGAPTAQNARL